MPNEQTAFLPSEAEAKAYAEIMKVAGWTSRAVKLGNKWAVKSSAPVDGA
jgi:hypothetical protein